MARTQSSSRTTSSPDSNPNPPRSSSRRFFSARHLGRQAISLGFPPSTRGEEIMNWQDNNEIGFVAARGRRPRHRFCGRIDLCHRRSLARVSRSWPLEAVLLSARCRRALNIGRLNSPLVIHDRGPPRARGFFLPGISVTLTTNRRTSWNTSFTRAQISRTNRKTQPCIDSFARADSVSARSANWAKVP